MQTLIQQSRLSWRQTISRFTYYSLGLTALWGLAFVLFLISGISPH